jgi:CRP-like cAMP-binding protein
MRRLLDDQAGQIGRTSTSGKRVRNAVLLSIPGPEFGFVRPHLEFLRLPHRCVLHQPNDKVQFAYFLNSGLISLMIETREGKTVEVGIVGIEGIVGIQCTVGLSRSPLREVVQIAGDGFRIEASALQTALLSTPHLRAILNRYAVVQGLQVAQTSACNRLHNVEQRFARWLLMFQTRSDSDSLVITHDFLAEMLGTDRPSISLVAGNFQRKRVIEYKRGVVKILSRRKLENLACECHAVIQQLGAESDLNKVHKVTIAD